jgi:hypothetical protein
MEGDRVPHAARRRAPPPAPAAERGAGVSAGDGRRAGPPDRTGGPARFFVRPVVSPAGGR